MPELLPEADLSRCFLFAPPSWIPYCKSASPSLDTCCTLDARCGWVKIAHISFWMLCYEPSLPKRWCCSLDSKLTSVQYGRDRGQLAAIPAEILNFCRCNSRLTGKGRSGPRSAVQHGIRSAFPLGSHRDHHCGIACTRQNVGLTRSACNSIRYADMV